ncbi:MAG TPA: hypothetical protein VNL38_02935, partial [Candidatus Nitrosotenuis sp.]|nr:hypothetical protein [Candidatus Nitrosotenuis sp.]
GTARPLFEEEAAMLQMKRGVNGEGVNAQMWFVLGIAYDVYLEVAGKDLTVTSLRDSHASKPKSLHNKGLAADLRTKNLAAPHVAAIEKKLKERLEPLGFDVVNEGDHIHIEYDPKQGEAWLREGVA